MRLQRMDIITDFKNDEKYLRSFKPTMIMIDRIRELIRQYQVAEAFWAAAENVENDVEKQTLFLRILSFKSNVALLQDDADRIKELADKGNPYMMYAFARIHDALQKEADSNDIKEVYYSKAADSGIGDAYFCLALMYKDGDLGEQDETAYVNMMRKALQLGSEKAVCKTIRNLIYGINGSECDPQKAYGMAESCVKGQDFPNPYYYFLMADADMELGRKTDAIGNYKTAAEYGCSSAYQWWAWAECCDEKGNVIDKNRFVDIMQKGIDVFAGECFLMLPMLISDVSYDDLNDEDKEELRQSLLKDLETGWMLGENICPLCLAEYYEKGSYGFEQDYAYAWMWYSRGAILRSSACYAALARMVLEDRTAPETYDEAYGYECAYKGLMLGGDDLLDVVINGYRHGFLTHHAVMIERKWLPEHERKNGRVLDDGTYDEEDCEPQPDAGQKYDTGRESDTGPEREAVQDTDGGQEVWTPERVESVWQTCMECVMGAEDRFRNRHDEWEIADLVRRYIDAAEELLTIPIKVNNLYSAGERLLDVLYEHPRLTLRLMLCQLNVLREIEASSGHEMSITEDLENEIREQRRNISLADEGRLDEIPQTGHLKHDPVEWTAKWEEVIDEADKMAYSRLKDFPRGMGFCFGFWSERAAALRKLGVEWRNPHLMNPRVMFD